jgi:hypothetical protein
MVVQTTATRARLGARIRNVVLVLFALFVAHDAIYMAQYGLGEGYARAMSEGGHDAYWTPTAAVIGIVAALVFLVSLGVIARLQRQSGARMPGPVISGPSYLHELGATWVRLLPMVVALYTIQENLEQLGVDGHLPGLAVLDGGLVLPIIAATTLLVAAIGSLLRWRIRVLVARIAAIARANRFPRPTASIRPPAWRSIAAAVAHHWLLVRPIAGRAPPLASTRIDVATA